MSKRNGKQRKRNHKIIAPNHQLDVLDGIIEESGISKYDIDFDSVFNPLAPLKTNRSNLLRAIEQTQQDNENILKQSMKFLAVPFVFAFSSFWMYFELLALC